MLIANDKNKSTRRILFIGTAILTICLFTCLANVAGVKTALMNKSRESFSNQIHTAERILAKNLEASKEIVSITAKLLSDDELAPKQAKIYSTLKEKQDDSDFDFFLFRSLTGSFYSAEGLASDVVNKYSFAWLTETDKTFWGLVNISNTKEEHYVVAFVEPVYSGSAKIGNVVAVKDLSSFLSDKSLEDIYQYGQCYITDNNGFIINASSYSKSYIDNNKNVYDGLIDYAKHSSSERLSIRNFESAMASKASDEMTFMSYQGDIYRIEYSQVSNLRGLYFLCLYNESTLEAEISPIVASSAFTCIITIILMIALITYVWISSKRANDTIERIAYSDEITRGKNLNYFKNRAAFLMQSNMETPYLVQRFDIANFRYINEAYGHNRADEILRGCIELAKTHFLEKEICVRMNADQFIVFSENNEGVDRRRDSYIRALNEHARSIGVKYPIRLKFGIYQVRKHDKDIDVIIDRANVARKSLKSDDKSLLAYYSDSLVTEMRKSDKIESEMQKALDMGEFNLYFQPKWDIVENKLSGAEVLVRWIKPDP
ncbi:MAG: diguanylate cyclase [Clostridiales bacterium]|nr:diguanylate cyclase [Clostridiales bacterium]